TLFHIRGSLGEIYAASMARHGAQMPSQAIEMRFRKAFASAPPLSFPGATGEVLQRLERVWWRTLVAEVMLPAGAFPRFQDCFNELWDLFQTGQGWELDPEAKQLLDHLAAQGYRMGIISNFDSRLRPLLRDLGIADHFQSVTLATEEGVMKPNPEIFRRVMQRHDLQPGEAIYVGDNPRRDVEGARAAGMTPVLVVRPRFVPGWETAPLPRAGASPSGVRQFASLGRLLKWFTETALDTTGETNLRGPHP
ncbi:MAG: HAD-IA family hydrolase, partial [Deltaproteobacteria bacterium]|nr:HAD-IA family hydrolase [Deltaproteobacteria bacterium]